MSINITVLDGNVTRDAELRTTQSGTKVLSFGFANNRRRGDQEHTTFIDCTIFGERAEKLAPTSRRAPASSSRAPSPGASGSATVRSVASTS